MELWDLLDENRLPLNRTMVRGEKKNKGEYHTVVEVWTVNSQKQVLLTLRDSRKELYPDKWENTGGSALAGETSVQAAVRELMEETGIVADASELTLLGTNRGAASFHDVYILHRDIEIEQLTMQDGETAAAKWVSMEQLDALIADGSLVQPVGERLSIFREKFEAYCALIWAGYSL